MVYSSIVGDFLKFFFFEKAPTKSINRRKNGATNRLHFLKKCPPLLKRIKHNLQLLIEQENVKSQPQIRIWFFSKEENNVDREDVSN